MTVSDSDLEALAAQLDATSAKLRSWKTAVVTPPPIVTPPVTPPATGFTDLGDPNVWNQTPVFKDTFANLSAPGASIPGWTFYPKGWTDTSKSGTYDPARISIVDRPDGVRALRQQVTNIGSSFGGCVVQPNINGQVGYFTSMRYTERRQLVQQDNGHDVVLGWPNKDSKWPKTSGEPDHIEYDTKNNPTIGGWLHVIGATSGQDHQVELPSDVKAYDGFHTITVEQIAGKSYRRYIDGKLYNVALNQGETPTAADKAALHLTTLASGYSVPGAEPLRICKQLESNGNKPADKVIVDTDFVVIQVAL